MLEDDKNDAKEEERPNEASNVNEEGLDSRYNHIHRKRMEEMRRNARRLKDTNILIMQRDEAGRVATRRSFVNTNSTTRVQATGRLRQQLESREGVMEFITGELDGMIEICAQAFSASARNPARIHLRVHRKAPRPKTSEAEIQLTTSSDTERFNAHSSRISNELAHFEGRVRELAANADYAKEREHEFHEQSIALNKAVKYWPIFRIAILLLGGYIQVSRVISYMKSRHIY